MSLQDSTQGYILSSPRTVFTLPSIIVDTREEDMSKLTKRLHYYKKKGVLRSLRKGLYAKWDYNEQEVACSLYTPCYLSLEYVLQRAGVIFQYDECLTCVSYLSREILVDNKNYSYRKAKSAILLNRKGIINQDNINIASPERAFLDTVYLYPHFYFDYPDILNKEKIMELLPIYENKEMETRVIRILE